MARFDIEIRSVQSCISQTFSVKGRKLDKPMTRVSSVAVVRDPLYGEFRDDVASLYALGEQLGAFLAERCVELIGDRRDIQTYGKGAIVGVGGDLEHAHALLHPMFGAPVRKAIGGGKEIIPSTVRIGVPGTVLTIPLFQKDDRWSFDHMDALDASVPDGPLDNEIAVILGMTTSGRPLARVRKP